LECLDTAGHKTRIALNNYLKRSKCDGKRCHKPPNPGHRPAAVHAVRVFLARREWRIHVVGFLTEDDQEVGQLKLVMKVLDKVANIAPVLKAQIVDCVFFAGASLDITELRQIARLCGDRWRRFVFNLKLIEAR